MTCDMGHGGVILQVSAFDDRLAWVAGGAAMTVPDG